MKVRKSTQQTMQVLLCRVLLPLNEDEPETRTIATAAWIPASNSQKYSNVTLQQISRLITRLINQNVGLKDTRISYVVTQMSSFLALTLSILYCLSNYVKANYTDHPVGFSLFQHMGKRLRQQTSQNLSCIIIQTLLQ